MSNLFHRSSRDCENLAERRTPDTTMKNAVGGSRGGNSSVGQILGGPLRLENMSRHRESTNHGALCVDVAENEPNRNSQDQMRSTAHSKQININFI